MPSASAASSERSERSDWSVGAHILQDFRGDSQKPPEKKSKKQSTRRRNENNKTRFPFPYLDTFPLIFGPKPRQEDARRTQDAPKPPQYAPRGTQNAQDAAKRREYAPKTLQDAPRAAQESQNDAKMEASWHENRIRKNINWEGLKWIKH